MVEAAKQQKGFGKDYKVDVERYIKLLEDNASPKVIHVLVQELTVYQKALEAELKEREKDFDEGYQSGYKIGYGNGEYNEKVKKKWWQLWK